jgi:hypothetical protein
MTRTRNPLRPTTRIALAGLLVLGIAAATIAYSQGMNAVSKAAAPASSADVTALKVQIARLTARVAELEKLGGGGSSQPDTASADREPGTIFKAPFTIVNQAGKPIVVVYEKDGQQGLSVRSPSGNPVVSLLAESNGEGSIAAFDGTAATGPASNLAALRFKDGRPELIVRGGDQAWARVTPQIISLDLDDRELVRMKQFPDYGGQVTVFSTSGEPLATLQSNDVGHGGQLLLGQEGTNRMQLQVNRAGSADLKMFDEGGIRVVIEPGTGFNAFDTQGKVVAQFGATPSGNNGRFSLANSAGQMIVEAGMLPDGLGTVRAGPSFGARPSALQIPDRIVGHK